ncbi:MAG: type II toxin-antitoxin system HicB family antitoxin [Bryobacteraceae bacterium]
MFLFQYPASLERCADGEVIVRFPDLRGTIAGGMNEPEALTEAADLLGSAIAHGIAEKEDIPAPSAPKRGQRMIAVPFWIAGKLAVYLAMREAGITNIELARRLGVSEAVVRRLLDPDHETKDRKLSAALAALGKELVMAVVPRKVA